jgi:hypothetical protein
MAGTIIERVTLSKQPGCRCGKPVQANRYLLVTRSISPPAQFIGDSFQHSFHGQWES